MIYVHVPFCKSFCTYCAFYSELCQDGDLKIKSYESALCNEIRERAEEIRETGNNTIYTGGGTPSVLPLSVLESIVKTYESATGFSVKDLDEFTVELNPDDVVHKGHDYARGLKALGVNRVSMGVQSFNDDILKWMNRRHNAERAHEAFSILREAGFDNISLDLIFGIGDFNGKQFTMELWKESIEKILAMSPEHISAYQLSVEEGSALEALMEKKSFVPASDENCAAQYELLCSMLREAGYEHYEISNFAKKGRRAMHNSAYWTHKPYVGLGPAAHSLGRDWKRSWNADNLDDYLKGQGSGYEVLSPEQIQLEKLMLGLRTVEGVHKSALDDSPGLKSMLQRGMIIREGQYYRIPENFFFISDSIIAEL